MKRARSIALLIGLALSQIAPAIAQTKAPAGPMTITLYSPSKYQRKGAAPSNNPLANYDFSRAYLSFATGAFGSRFGMWELSYGLLTSGQDDWFQVSVGDEERSIIKDLGLLGWNEKFKLPIIPPLATLKPGEHRHVTLDFSSEDTSSKERSRGLPSEIRGAPSARDQDIGLPSRDPDAGPEIPTPLVAVPLPKRSKKSQSDPVAAKIITGHMYLVRVVNAHSDFYVLVHVDDLVTGDNCTISWKRVASP